MALRFGTAGVPRSAKGTSTEDGIRRIRELGLDHLEMEWVRQVPKSAENARNIRAVAEELNVTLTAHGPYYINLNALEPEKMAASIKRVLDTARMGYLCGAKSVTFHAAFLMKMPPDRVYGIVRDKLKDIMDTLAKENVAIEVRPELAGKLSSWGSLEEIIHISKDIKGIKPTIDFAHQHARTNGGFNTYDEFCKMLEALKKGLGAKILDNMHIHVSGIKYSPKGELEHLNLKNSDFNWEEFIQALLDFDVGGYLVCESPNLEEDALMLQRAYKKKKKWADDHYNSK